jgi:hypothetical protein
LWKQAVIVPVFKKRNTSSVGNWRPISILNNFLKAFAFIIYAHVSHFLKYKLNFSQHGFINSKSTVPNLVTFRNFVTPLICLQGQTDSICFDFSNAFDILPHALLLHKLNNYGLSYSYLNWVFGCLTNKLFYVRFSGILLLLFVVLPGILQGSVLGPLIFNICVCDLCEVINHSRLHFADDLKVCRAINSPSDCLLL